MFSESSSLLAWAVWQLQFSPTACGTQENILQNLFHNLLPQTVFLGYYDYGYNSTLLQHAHLDVYELLIVKTSELYNDGPHQCHIIR